MEKAKSRYNRTRSETNDMQQSKQSKLNCSHDGRPSLSLGVGFLNNWRYNHGPPALNPAIAGTNVEINVES